MRRRYPGAAERGQLSLLIDTAAAGQMLEVTASQVARLCRDGLIQAQQISGRWCLTRSDVEDYGRRRGHWRPLGVVGGKAAAKRLGVMVGENGRLELTEKGGA